MVVGYSYWGFLGDKKLDGCGNELSTPDGNAFYSWSVVWDLVSKGHEVIRVMPDRDKPGYNKFGDKLFASFAQDKRCQAYMKSKQVPYGWDWREWPDITEEQVHVLWDEAGLRDCDVILHEWRMGILGRNDIKSKSLGFRSWQPDLFLQSCLISYCAKNHIKLVVFDLDYKLSHYQAVGMSKKLGRRNFCIFELGDKWRKERGDLQSQTVFIPFDFNEIYTFKPKLDVSDSLVYVGNRYERDWCIDKYIPEHEAGVVVYGNWLEGGRDSASRWPGIDFRKRINASEMYEAYSNAACTILLAKKDYCLHHFMTARLIEAVFYGVVPLFIEEYGEEYIRHLVGSDVKYLIVKSKEEVVEKMRRYKKLTSIRACTLRFLREVLCSKFDVVNFTTKLLDFSSLK